MAAPERLDVREIREQRGMTQAQLAVRIGVSQPTVALWEAGKRKPSGPSQILLRQMLRTKARK